MWACRCIQVCVDVGVGVGTGEMCRYVGMCEGVSACIKMHA